MAAIETWSLSKRYGSLHAVDGLDLTVERGEVFGFLGPNGAGKSTTIAMLLDLVRPTDGEASVLGYDPQAEPRAVRERVGALAEPTGLYDRATARDHVRLAGALRGVDTDATAVLDRVGIADAADQPVGGFSTGMRQRLGLALALVGEPSVLVLDEPMTGLDPHGARRLREIVRAERDRGAAVLFSSHIMTQVATLCDRVGVMHDGDLVAVDTVAGLRERVDVPATLTVEVEGSDPPAELADLEGVRAVDRAPTGVRVTCHPRAKAAVVDRVRAAGATVTDIRSEEASLERVFRALTGDR